MYRGDHEQIVALRLPNMGLNVSSGSSLVCSVLSVVMVFWPKIEFHLSKLSDSKFWVKYTSRGIIYLKEAYENCYPKVKDPDPD